MKNLGQEIGTQPHVSLIVKFVIQGGRICKTMKNDFDICLSSMRIRENGEEAKSIIYLI